MNLFELFAKVSLDTADYDKKVKNVTKSGQSLGSTLKSGLFKAGSIAAKGIGLITGAATAAGGALLALEASTEEYRIAQGKLNTAFEAAGYSTETAKKAYTDFYKILGDTDTATEASQLLAKLSENEQDMTTWTRAAAGVWGTFGDSLPIEGLIESANETAKVAQVTGSLADALNWAGINEDDFNKKLAECSDESERNQLIMDTLSSTYGEAANAFYQNNEALIASRAAQAEMDASLAKLGESVSNVKSRILADFLPGLSSAAEGLAGVIAGVEGADQQFSDAIGGLINTAVERLPEFLDFGIQIITALLIGIISNIPQLVAAIPQIVGSIITALQTAWPEIKAAGLELLRMLGNGIVEYGPQLLATVASIALQIIAFLATNVKNALSAAWAAISGMATSIWESIKNAIIQPISAVSASIITTWATIKSNTLQAWESIKSAISTKIELAKSAVTSAVNNIKSIASSAFDAVSSKAKSVWETVKQSIQTPIEKARDIVRDAINSIKGFFNFKFKWPKLVLPHFTFTGSWNPFDWPEKFPSIGVKWYKKAMHNAMLLNRATIFGVDESGKYLAGGEAGPEIVAGANTISKMIYDAVKAAMGESVGGIYITQNIYSEAKTAADLMQEARYEAEKAVMLGV